MPMFVSYLFIFEQLIEPTLYLKTIIATGTSSCIQHDYGNTFKIPTFLTDAACI